MLNFVVKSVMLHEYWYESIPKKQKTRKEPQLSRA